MTKRDVAKVGTGVNILLVDHEDSFVHTLANYFRQTGAGVTTVRTPAGGGVRPDEARSRRAVARTSSPISIASTTAIRKARARNLPIFGVCLGLQALAEAYGGELRHRRDPDAASRRVSACWSRASSSRAWARKSRSAVTARSSPIRVAAAVHHHGPSRDGTIMGIEHAKEPVTHRPVPPRSIMTLGSDAGMRMIENVVAHLASAPK